MSSYIPFTDTLRDGRILSTITVRTDNPLHTPHRTISLSPGPGLFLII
jgi:hypothetical protein